MNRYMSRPGGPSRATATTLCQKCLKKDNYECKTVAQERPYVSRPSRTQQLANPKLVPSLTSDVSQELLRKKGVADEQLAKVETERALKRERENDELERGTSKRRRDSSSSVSSISTNLSRSPSSPREIRMSNENRSRSASADASTQKRISIGSERKRRRESSSSADSYSTDDAQEAPRRPKEWEGRGGTRRRFRRRSPSIRGRRTASRSPRSPYRSKALDSKNDQEGIGSHEDMSTRVSKPRERARERSLSPFSKRLALTQALSAGK